MGLQHLSIFDLPRITSFAEAMEVGLSKKFRQAKGVDLEIMPIKADSITVLHGSDHLARRILENPLFRKGMLKHLELDVLDASIHRRISQVIDGGDGRGDLLTIARLSLLPLTASFIGLEDASANETAEQLSAYAAVFAPAAALEFKIGPLEGERELSLVAAREFSERLFRPAWERRKEMVRSYQQGQFDAGDLPSDLITVLLLHAPYLSEDIALREAIHYVVASTDTTVLAVATTVQHLTEWFERNPGQRDRIADSLFLQSAVFEAIRLHSPPAMLRSAEEDVELSTGRRVRAGERVMIDVRAANCDSAVFGADADRFNPFRTVPDSIKPYGMGFGAGSYACIGKMMVAAHLGDEAVDEDSQSIGTVLRIVRRLFDAGVSLDPQDPPVLRQGWLQERYVRFPIRLGAALSLAGQA